MGIFCNHKELKEEIAELRRQLSDSHIEESKMRNERDSYKRDKNYIDTVREENDRLSNRVRISERKCTYLEECFKQITKAHEAMKNV